MSRALDRQMARMQRKNSGAKTLSHGEYKRIKRNEIIGNILSWVVLTFAAIGLIQTIYFIYKLF